MRGAESRHYPQMGGQCGLQMFFQAHSFLVFCQIWYRNALVFRTALCCSIALAAIPKAVDV